MRLFVIGMIALLSSSVFANIEIAKFDDPKMEQHYKQLINELRCLVCQNQNLADSNAELAQDLRAQIYTMLQQGKSKQDVVDFMVVRYGDFVLYRPPFKLRTVVLWVGPFLFLILGMGFLVMYIRRQPGQTGIELTEEEHRQASILLDNNDKGKTE